MSIIKHVTLQKIVAHDFRYDPRIYSYIKRTAKSLCILILINENISVNFVSSLKAVILSSR